MNRQINLVSHKKKKIFNRERFLHLIQYVSRFFLVIVVLSAIGLFVVNRTGTLLILQQQDKTITTNLSYVQQKIIKFLLIRERLQGINPLITSDTNIDIVLAQLGTSLPKGVSLDNLTISDKKLTFTVSSSSLLSLSTFLDFVINKVNQKSTYKTVTISNFSANANVNSYTVNLDITTYE